MALSRTGSQMAHLTGVRAIMKDIIETLKDDPGSWVNLSAGNPLVLPEVAALWRQYTQELLDSAEFDLVVGRYGMSQGYEPLIDAVVAWFRDHYGWPITRQHILITPGSQSLYFFAANSFGGVDEHGQMRSIVLPCLPDYTGYGGVALVPGIVHGYQPVVDILGSHRFKYRPDFEHIQVNAHTGAMIFSRPGNPTGNILTDSEVQRLLTVAATANVPVLIDSAYAPPFPDLAYTPMQPVWAENVIHCLSLSKAGLPGERIGVAIGDPRYLKPLEAFQANAAIHSSRFGQALAARAIATGDLARLSTTVIKPHYQAKMQELETALNTVMPDDLPWYLHQAEGSLFAWIWFDELPITDWELYQTLKEHKVIVVPGGSFFPGLSSPWIHQQQCLRISLTASMSEIHRGIDTLGRVIKDVYARRPALVSG